MAGTVTHSIPLIQSGTPRPYLNTKFMVRSSNELIVVPNKFAVAATETVVSLDVDSLFTAVPAAYTFDILIDAIHMHSEISPPS